MKHTRWVTRSQLVINIRDVNTENQSLRLEMQFFNNHSTPSGMTVTSLTVRIDREKDNF